MSDDAGRPSPGPPAPPDRPELGARIAELWAEFRDTMFARVAALDEAAGRLEEGSLDPEARRAAFMHAHKLAGSLGTFGLLEASKDAQTVERLLGGTGPLGGADAAAMAEAARRLRCAVELGPC